MKDATNTASGDLIDRLAEHKTLGSAPREELAWLAKHGSLRRLAAGEVLSHKGMQVEGLYVVLSGHVSLSADRGAGLQKMIEWRAGDVSGVLPYSRLVTPPGDAIAQEPTEILSLDREHIRALTHECFEITSILVRTMLDRARLFTSSELHNEKMISLGKLSAGLAHELNNPASAIERSASLLEDRLVDSEKATRALGAARLSDSQLAAVDAVLASCLAGQRQVGLSCLEQSDREEAIWNWLSAHKLDPANAAMLADTEVTFDALEQLAVVVSGPALDAVLRWAAANCAARRLAASIQGAAMRISGLVMAIKGFTNMDQVMVAEPVDLGPSLRNTLSVLQSRAREKSAEVSVELESGLPAVLGYAGELNQIWGNLIDNALDAVPVGGRVDVSASCEEQRVVVRIVDNGPGIPTQNLARVFDPFFTTKPLGQGTGLGLDIVRRLVRHNDGAIHVESKQGRTEFRVTLPIAKAGPEAMAEC
ncbi:ATP-binding protein [Telmatobacter sp. DSM 110680]|uniref:histidine kinase n=1 Tax=Telmatobacter sp. DSM 110680 TaxID=3036704 RepID=A0AAU7DG74_9BACT